MLLNQSAWWLEISILVAASLLDFYIGDPQEWMHPVQVMGWGIKHYQRWILGHWSQPIIQRFGGIVLGLGLIGLSGLVGWLIVVITWQIHAVLGWTIATFLLASCFAGRSLRIAAIDVLLPLTQKDQNISLVASENLTQARHRLSFYVGRDTANLSRAEILRAVLETVTENATDGVLAPLFYALLGAAIPGVGPVPLTLAYKAASTLDSMVGYREMPYTHLGWFSAKFEDGMTWLPCRCVVLTLTLLSGHPKQVIQICRRDASADPSPNAGWSECAYAATLGVQLGGINWYRGVPKQKPLLGNPIAPIQAIHIDRALNLTRDCFLLWLILGCIGLGFGHRPI